MNNTVSDLNSPPNPELQGDSFVNVRWSSVIRTFSITLLWHFLCSVLHAFVLDSGNGGTLIEAVSIGFLGASFMAQTMLIWFWLRTRTKSWSVWIFGGWGLCHLIVSVTATSVLFVENISFSLSSILTISVQLYVHFWMQSLCLELFARVLRLREVLGLSKVVSKLSLLDMFCFTSIAGLLIGELVFCYKLDGHYYVENQMIVLLVSGIMAFLGSLLVMLAVGGCFTKKRIPFGGAFLALALSAPSCGGWVYTHGVVSSEGAIYLVMNLMAWALVVEVLWAGFGGIARRTAVLVARSS